MSDALTVADFQPYVGESFGALTLAAVVVGPARPAELPASFSLEFIGPEGLAQGMVRVSHAALGELDIFMTPIAAGRYEAVFG